MAVSTLVATSDAWKSLELTWDGGVLNAEPSGWKAFGFDDDAWPASYVPPDPDDGWLVIDGCDFMGSQARTNEQLKSAYWIARKEFTVAEDVAAQLRFASDDWCKVYIDEVLVASLHDADPTTAAPASNYETGATATVSLTAGNHCIAIEGWNQAGGAEGNDWAVNPNMVEARLSTGTGVLIDWNGDGFDVGDDDDVTANVISWTISRGASAEITGGAQPGSCTLVLKNPDDIYNPRNGDSDLDGLLRDGPPVWVGPNADGALTGADPRGLFAGRITDITLIPSPGTDSPATVEIVCEDMLAWSRRTPVQIDYAEGRSHGALRLAALTAAGETRHDLANEIMTMQLSHADGDLLSVLDAINAANGTRHLAKPSDAYSDWFHYTTRNRQWRLDATSDATLSATDDHVTGTSGWRHSADTVINRQKATVTPIAFTPATFTVWQADSLPFGLTEDKPRTFIVDFDDVVRDPVLDIASTGDTVTSTFTPFATGGKIELSVGAGDSATVTGLSVEGRLARRLPAESVVENDTTSQAAPRGVREGGEISGEYVGVIAAAQGIAAHVVWRYGNPQLRPTLTVENWLPEQFELDLYDVIAFTSTHLGMSARLFEIVGLTHEGNLAHSSSLHHHVTTYVLQECRVQADPGWFVLDTSELDSADVLAY